MININSFGIIAGDLRQLYCARSLAEDGFEVMLSGFDKCSDAVGMQSDDPGEVIRCCDAIILPLPVSKDGSTIFAPFSSSPPDAQAVLSMIDNRKPVFCGMSGKRPGHLLSEKNSFCYSERGEFAAANAPDFNGADRTVLSKTVALAMLAKVYAEKPVQDYNKVIEYANVVKLTPGMELEPDYATLWGYDEEKKDCVKRNTSEGILEVHYTTGNGNWETWMYGRQLDDWDFYFTWAKWITPSRDLISDFEKEGDEVRFNESVVYYECTWSNYYPAAHYPFMYKCRSSYQNRYKLRLADIMLLQAEAYAYLGKNSEAASLVNEIRNRVGLAPVDASGDMIETVLHERRLELAFEGQRWFDLCRNGKVEKYMNAVYAKDSGRLPQKRLFDANSYLLPVPQKALDENVNLEQNPGY